MGYYRNATGFSRSLYRPQSFFLGLQFWRKHLYLQHTDRANPDTKIHPFQTGDDLYSRNTTRKLWPNLSNNTQRPKSNLNGGDAPLLYPQNSCLIFRRCWEFSVSLHPPWPTKHLQTNNPCQYRQNLPRILSTLTSRRFIIIFLRLIHDQLLGRSATGMMSFAQ